MHKFEVLPVVFFFQIHDNGIRLENQRNIQMDGSFQTQGYKEELLFVGKVMPFPGNTLQKVSTLCLF